MVCNPVITVLWLNSGLFSLHQREDGEQLALQSSLSCLPACLPFLLILCLWLSLLVKNTLTPIHQKQNRNECVCAHYWHVIIRSDGGQTICKKQECVCEHALKHKLAWDGWICHSEHLYLINFFTFTLYSKTVERFQVLVFTSVTDNVLQWYVEKSTILRHLTLVWSFF